MLILLVASAGRHRRAEPLEDAFGVSVEDAHANEMPESAQVEKMREPELSVALIEGMSVSDLDFVPVCTIT